MTISEDGEFEGLFLEVGEVDVREKVAPSKNRRFLLIPPVFAKASVYAKASPDKTPDTAEGKVGEEEKEAPSKNRRFLPSHRGEGYGKG
jgi:hypothetical protein